VLDIARNLWYNVFRLKKERVMKLNNVIRAIDNDSDVAKELKARIAELEAKLGLVKDFVEEAWEKGENMVCWDALSLGVSDILATEPKVLAVNETDIEYCEVSGWYDANGMWKVTDGGGLDGEIVTVIVLAREK